MALNADPTYWSYVSQLGSAYTYANYTPVATTVEASNIRWANTVGYKSPTIAGVSAVKWMQRWRIFRIRTEDAPAAAALAHRGAAAARAQRRLSLALPPGSEALRDAFEILSEQDGALARVRGVLARDARDVALLEEALAPSERD